jgi:hypothetical protein
LFCDYLTFTKEIQMIETDESEDEFEDLSKLTDLSKLYNKLIMKTNVENKWSSEKMYEQIKRKLPIDGQEKTFLNGEVGNDKITNRQSIMEENLLDDHPKVIGFHCNPNAKKTFESPTFKQEIKKALNSKGRLISECLLDFFKNQRKFDKFLPQNLKRGQIIK